MPRGLQRLATCGVALDWVQYHSAPESRELKLVDEKGYEILYTKMLLYIANETHN